MEQIFNSIKIVYNDKKYLLFFVFCVSVVFSLIFLIFFRNIGPFQHKEPSTDYVEYYKPVAESLIQGKGYSINGTIPHNMAPGFSLVLSFVFVLSDKLGVDRLQAIVLMNVIFVALGVCFLFLLAESIFGRKIALLSSFLWMTYPFSLWFLKTPHTEVLFIPFFFFGVFLYSLALKDKSFKMSFWAGLFFGLASFTRLIGLFLPVFLIIFYFFQKTSPVKKRAILAAFLIIGYLVVIVPWAGFLVSKTGKFLPAWLFRSSLVFGFTSALSSGDKTAPGITTEAKESLQKIKEANSSQGDKQAFSLLFEEFSKNPLLFLKLIILRALRPWYATYSMWWEGKILLVQSFYLITALAGLYFAFKKHKNKIADIFLFLVVISYFWLVAVSVGSILRYMIPVMALAMVFSAIFIDKMLKKFKIYDKLNLSDNSLS